jgi:hypothetical protein
VLIDEGHAVAGLIAAQHAAAAEREVPGLRQEFVLHEVDHLRESLRIGVEGGMNVEAATSAGAGAPFTSAGFA